MRPLIRTNHRHARGQDLRALLTDAGQHCLYEFPAVMLTLVDEEEEES